MVATTTFGTYDLTNAIKIIQPPTQYLLEEFFPKTVMSEKCSISFDVETDGEHIAPFVHPCVEGKIVEGEGYQTHTVDPAYIKVKRALKPKDTFTRMPGEQFGGTMSNESRRNAMFQEELMYQKQRGRDDQGRFISDYIDYAIVYQLIVCGVCSEKLKAVKFRLIACAGILPPDAKSLNRTILRFWGNCLHYRVGNYCVSTINDPHDDRSLLLLVLFC